ncbi:AraC family transcriptional regulator [uncultured Croceitalea sp.]|uniref:AraC family transcriptional regulator n=1 Tax=uncultured Croceitalea sp. TaxID=1798908 RepID=UPI003305E602
MSKIVQYHLHKLHPQKLQFEIYDLKKYLKKSGQKATVPHSHSYHQLIWFFDSKSSHRVDFNTYDVSTNTIIFIAKDQVHAFEDNEETEGLLIHFNDSFFMHTEVDIFLKYNIFKTHKNPCYALSQEAITAGKTYMQLIKNEMVDRKRFGFEDTVRFLLKCFLIQLERTHQTGTDRILALTSIDNLRFYHFKELVEENYKKGLPVSEYADLMSISTKTLNTITKKVSDRSPSEHISDRVVLQAKRLLRFTELHVGEVAFKVGFDDPSYFIKYFKRQVGFSPMVFRKNSF